MSWYQRMITLRSRSRGFYLITDEVVDQIPELANIKIGLAHFFLQHTSAGLTLNENADPTVRSDFETYFTRLVPEDMSLYEHTLEGPDDMTSHIKTSLLGSSVTVPVTNGRLNLGTWQGLYLCEYRNRPHRRNLVITLEGSQI